ncbi:MAG TPA: NAD(P)(+) transhydrogenase (Re/Si-specific) subunit beta [Actinomycetota bacterium]|jgi:NAD(P) transhydrogenase subunit beta|nr:NAD(P)(+) transhydrogenase (Re/Si-specific) subunit beta [Actinomycetota bacterium]
MRDALISLAYLFAAGCFILALKWLSHPTTARRGVHTGEIGMAVAIVATLFNAEIVEYQWILLALVLGSAVGIPLGLLVPMTAVPQRTALSHAFGALAAGIVGTAEYYLNQPHISKTDMVPLGLEVVLGFLTFTGSMIAAGKLQGIVRDRPWIYKGQNVVNLSILGSALVMVGVLVFHPGRTVLFPIIIAVSLVFGVMLVIRIGGADMPTVISLLNSYAGLSASMMGFVLDNKLLIIAGALDGSSGLILSIIMCRAMNRSFTNVLFGGFGAEDVTAGNGERRPVRSVEPEETAFLLDAARTVVIVPGYGMAAAQAQHKVRELTDVLMRRGVDVKFAIHPVAGRMPGHMNVLLAEANVPYDLLYDLDQINPEFPQTDVALVVGANDVVNPAARTDTTSPIYGMPILDVDAAGSIIVCKRSMRSGFAGVDNDLFYLDETQMLFGDAKSSIGEVVDELSKLPAKEVAVR